ncbi:MAG: Bax inhibitor-1/YccA family protein [bacterium]|nr:Bax inhibitor-1/YccA family protein [bacterium]
MDLENDFTQVKTGVKSSNAVQAEQTRYLLRVYNWMGGGLLLTGLVAWFTSQSSALINMLAANPLIPIGLFIGQIALVGVLAFRVMKVRAKTAAMLFLGYAILTGLSFSFIFLAYTKSSIAATFVVTAGTFGAMSLYGAATKKDLTSWGSFLFMGLVGIMIAFIVNIFLQSSMVQWVASGIGVLVFTGLTAYDTQKILQMNIIGNEGTEEDTKEAIRGALTLYLDFINLFLMLLHFMGGNRD